MLQAVERLLSYRSLVLPLMAMWKFALLVGLVSVAEGVGAFGTLWVLDLRYDPHMFCPGRELFTIDRPDYARNEFAMISSHPSQYWYRVDAIYVDDPKAIGDVSDIYSAKLRGQRRFVYIGYFSFLLIMAKLLPMSGMNRTVPFRYGPFQEKKNRSFNIRYVRFREDFVRFQTRNPFRSITSVLFQKNSHNPFRSVPSSSLLCFGNRKGLIP